jgi:cobaltochelatase CobN
LKETKPATTRILLLLGNPLYEKPIVQVTGDLAGQFGQAISVKYHLILDDGSAARLDVGKVEKDIREANIILLDKMSTTAARESDSETVISLLEKYKNGKTTLGLSVPGPIMARITNMGSFSSDSFVRKPQEQSGLKRIGSIFSSDSVSFSSEGLRVKRSWLSPAARLLQFGKSKHIQNYIRIYRYWEFGDQENMLNLILFLAKEYGGLDIKKKIEDPRALPNYAIYHPRAPRLFTDTDKYLDWYFKSTGATRERPTIGLLFYLKHYVTGNLSYLDLMIERLEEQQVNVMPVMSEGITNMEAIKKFFIKGNGTTIDTLISFPLFRLEGGPSGGDYQRALKELQQLNVPMLKPITTVSTAIKDWEENISGISPIHAALAVQLPEMDGAIEPIMVAGFKASDGKDAGGIAPIEERIGKVARRAAAWGKLRKKANAEKRVAFILYNYPPGKGTIGSAAYLDVFSSLINILNRMKEAGYEVGVYPRNARDFLRIITQRNLVNVDKATWTNIERAKRNAFTVDSAQYDDWFGELPEPIKEEMKREWGDPPGEVMLAGNELLIPGIQFGNIFVGFQPARGWGEDVSKMYHDRNLPPHHQYLAFYRWVERVYKADAMVHFGTHGTLEFTPGKQVGLSENCFPDAILPEVPNIYLYLVTGSSEGTIAKRRVYATIINYNTPPMTISSAYANYAQLEDFITQYYEITANNPGRAGEAKKQILEKAKEVKLVPEMAEDFSIDDVYHDIIEMKSSLIPRGVHIIGKKLTRDDETDYLMAALRFERGEILPIQKILCAALGVDWEVAKKQPANQDSSGKTYGEILSEVDKHSRDFIREVALENKAMSSAIKKTGIKLSREQQNQLQRTLDFGVGVAQSLRESVELEVANTLRALNGEYIPPGTGGDPVRSPDVLPTGRNMVGFDPRKVPTKLAEERAHTITKQILEDYVKEHNEYPESVGVVLFSMEVMQTHGETVAEIFELIGVRPKRSGVGNIDPAHFEVLPLEELGRPRIDVAVDVSGIFRDTFPEALEFIGKIIRAVAELDEPVEKNFIRKHSLEIEKNLIAAGQPPAEAKKFSYMRTFGVGAGIYGTNISKMIASSDWKEEKDIAEMYMDKQSHFYGDGVYGEKNPQALNEILKHVSVCAQVRSSSLYGISDLDHYYEHLGGFTSSVGSVRKKKPVVMVADSSSEKIITRKLSKQIEAEGRMRFLDQKWIDGMMDSSRGVGIIADRTEHMMGWAATTGDVDPKVFKEMAGKYVFDDENRKKIMEKNPWQLNDVMKKLEEAHHRGYWQITPEEMDKMKKVYLELENEIEEREE